MLIRLDSCPGATSWFQELEDDDGGDLILCRTGATCFDAWLCVLVWFRRSRVGSPSGWVVEAQGNESTTEWNHGMVQYSAHGPHHNGR
jgi:hypothetical protein